MTICRGGSWDGIDWPGEHHTVRVAVLFVRRPDGEQDLTRSETYIRDPKSAGWIYAHPGGKTEADGPWYAPKV